MDRDKFVLPFNLYVLDADNHVVEVFDFVTWGEYIQGNNKRVAWTQITSETEVSTVFLGIDHRFYGKGPPVLFETMIFGGPLDRITRRYSSYDDAMTGHKAAVARVRAAIGQKQERAE